MAFTKFFQTFKFSPLRQTLIILVTFFLSFIFFAASHNNASKKKPATGSSPNTTVASAQAANSLNPEKDVVPGVIYVKFKDDMLLAKGASRTSISSVDALCEKYRVHSIEPVFPYLQNSNKKKADVLRRIYYVKFPRSMKVTTVCDAFAADENIEHVAPQFRFKTQAVPDDPRYTQQRIQLELLNLPGAWDIVKGDSGKVVIAIVDGGTEWMHEDLADNIWVNEDETAGNNRDDDQNGFVDDVRGWNFANGTNNPTGLPGQPINGTHGTRTAGIAGAVTDNAIGIAGTSWNAQIMPINASAQEDTVDEAIVFGYEGIVYAADNGADIISNSWGGDLNPEFASFIGLFQDIIDFAHENGSVVVVAAGNGGTNNDNTLRIPSILDHVLSVGSIDVNSTKSGFSNYGVKVHVYAPGQNVPSTHADNEYGFQSGTSFSTPYAAGVAALVKTLHPDWSPDQVREQVRVTAVNIEGQNPGLGGLLGKGRIDAFRAVTDTTIPSIRVVDARFTGAGDNGVIDPGETIDLTINFVNYLAPASNVTVTLSDNSPRVSVTNAQATIASINTNETASASFQFEITSPLPEGDLITFFVDLATGNYSDRDIFTINPTPPQILTHNTGVLQTTITSKGTIGFLTNLSDSNGVGFVLNDFNYLFEGGLMIGIGNNSVSNTIRGVNFDQDDDFRPASGSFLHITSPGAVADQESFVAIVDSLSNSPIGVRITQETYSYNSEPFNQFVIFKYTIRNTGSQTLSNLRVGLFFDWDINADALDFSRFDTNRSMGTVQNFSSNPTRLSATKVLTNKGATGFHAIDNRNEIDLANQNDPSQNGFTDIEKWIFMSDGIQVTTRNNIDISTVTATGPFEISASDSTVVAFAVLAAESQEDLNISADAAQYLWENNLSPEINQAKPNISTAVLQNPAASKYADIVVISDRSLEAVPAVELTVGGNTASVPMSRLFGTRMLYKGAIEFNTAGAYTITTRASAVLTGADSTQTRTYQVALAKPGVPTSLSLNAGHAILSLGKNAVRSETYIIGNFEEMDDETIYTFGPAGRLQEPAEMTLSYDTQKFIEPGKLFIYHQSGEKWEALPTRVFEASGLLKAKTEKLGKFKLVYDGLFAGDNTVPSVYALKQNYPNPFNPATTIEYDLPEAGEVVLTIYNQLGQVIKTLVQNLQPAGRYRISWDARNEDGRKVSSGIYFYQIKTSGFVQTNKMVLMQ
jgi:hypothetical protein